MYNDILWYEKPAENFDEALPVGNGRIGGMVYGNPSYETIHLNEDSVWSGGKRNRNNPNSLEHLEEIRDLLINEKIEEAEKLAFKYMQGVTPNSRHYMPLGDLFISMENIGDISNYKRSLDISNAMAITEFTSNDVRYLRTVFVSEPDSVMIIHIEGDKPNSVNVSSHIDGRDDYFDDSRPYDDETILYTGGTGGIDGISFASAMTVTQIGGEIYTEGGSLCVKNADEVTYILSAQTSYRTDDYVQSALLDCEFAKSSIYDELLYRHISDYQEFYNRVSLQLNDNSNGASELPTNKRIERLKNGDINTKDNTLYALYFNYGRYLMISASREGTLPMNLQGIWNKDMWPAWGCRFTVNINTEMNYWIAESCNLSECHKPLFDHIEVMRPNGRETAKTMYGCKGFVCHHNTDIWGDTAPQDLWIPATIWPMGGAWLCLHIYEHYLYTLDKDFLADKYETLKECAEFFVDFLIEDKQGRLVTCPSVSPENTYLTESGSKGSLCVAPSMDSQIITVLFNDVIQSAKILGKEDTFIDKLKSILDKLPKIEIGKYGQIKEWAIDYDEVEIGHRHISQLFALYPADLISPYKTPELSKSARATIERRLSHGGGHTGWSRAWIINMWARLLDSDMVEENLFKLLAYSTNANLLDSHPPFQIDGNFGGTAGIVESLMQSHSGEINILPCIPKSWESGSVRGIKARGNFEISIDWEDNKLKSVEIISLSGGVCKVRTNCDTIKLSSNGKDVDYSTKDGIIIFNTIIGERYNIFNID
ncbi:MAG: glycosyl hydrolase family 95 catalytic domain-containing protein [Oscillospiraceae bacterium]